MPLPCPSLLPLLDGWYKAWNSVVYHEDGNHNRGESGRRAETDAGCWRRDAGRQMLDDPMETSHRISPAPSAS